MAHVCKTILRRQGIEYILWMNRKNSRYCYVEGVDRKTKEHIADFARIDNKTDEVKYLVFGIDDAVKETIEAYAKG